MENTLIYNECSETIRQMPQNYLIAYRSCSRWIVDCDISADKDLATRVFNAVFDYDTRYGDGLNLLSKVTPNSKFKKIPYGF